MSDVKSFTHNQTTFRLREPVSIVACPYCQGMVYVGLDPEKAPGSRLLVKHADDSNARCGQFDQQPAIAYLVNLLKFYTEPGGGKGIS